MSGVWGVGLLWGVGGVGGCRIGTIAHSRMAPGAASRRRPSCPLGCSRSRFRQSVSSLISSDGEFCQLCSKFLYLTLSLLSDKSSATRNSQLAITITLSLSTHRTATRNSQHATRNNNNTVTHPGLATRNSQLATRNNNNTVTHPGLATRNSQLATRTNTNLVATSQLATRIKDNSHRYPSQRCEQRHTSTRFRWLFAELSRRCLAPTRYV